MTKTQAKKDRRFALSPALVLSVVALFAALSGVAAALPGQNTVNSGDIVDETVKARDIKDGGVKAGEISDGIQPRSNSVAVAGGTGENGVYVVEQVTASCAPGEELISGSGHWSNNADEELFLQEIVLDHNAEQVTVRGGNDTGASRTLFAVAHCIQA
jgi:hypothetical protein